MTKYILHGGRTSQDTPGNDRFYKEFSQVGAKTEVKIVMCYFSRPKDQWDQLLERDSQKILSQSHKKTLLSVPETPSQLFRLLKSHQVLYVAGGEPELIEPAYKELTNLKKALAGKVYAGSSMGAFMASSHYVLSSGDQDVSSVHHGLGLVPVKCLCHWDVDDKKAKKIALLAKHKPSLPIITLNESEFTTFFY